jgi:DNA-binding winged helix-turn-helix (wHTH) protein
MGTDSLHTTAESPRYVRFGPFHIDRQRQQVYRGDNKLRLHGKIYQLLLGLIERQGEIVVREELKQALWPADTPVDYDANITTTVAKLRQALGESTEKPSYIETIPRKGYSFNGEAEFSDVPFPQALWSAVAGAQSVDDASSSTPSEKAYSGSRKWITPVIVGLILAGILVGAAMLWLARVAPQLPH